MEFIIKEFLQVSKNVLLYLSLLFCSLHGYCCRFDMIPRAEWRLEVRLSASLFRNWKSHGTKMYDFCCGLPEYLDNRETVVFFFFKTLDFLFICFTHTSTYVHPVCGVIIGFDDVNWIICKQVYSFFQNIKRSNHMLHQNSFYLE